MSIVGEATLFLGTAVVMVPLFKRLGLGSVLGYLAAGVVIGPWGAGFVNNVDNILHFSELGVVLLLFIIGLELQLSRLWALRKPIFLLGGLQVLATALLLYVVATVFGLGTKPAIIAGLALSLSSTAFALQMLAEKRQLGTQHGRSSFAILLFQDLAVIPMLAILPLLAIGDDPAASTSIWLPVGKAIIVLIAIVFGGHYLLRPFFRYVASTRNQDILTAAALLVVLGTAVLMELVGLSMALGAFLAGVLLADSEYRHELESRIEPFKGLLLGLFFIAVGMSVDLNLIVNQPVIVVGLTLGLVALKFLVLFIIGKLYKHKTRSAINLAVTLSQGGEFAFVIMSVATGAQLMETELANLLIVVVTLSMAVTPLLFALNEALQRSHTASPQHDYDEIDDDEAPVIIAGFGRFGQVVARVLSMKGIHFTALEASFEQVDFVRKFGNKIYFGDAGRLDLLRAAGADKATVFVLAIDDVETSLQTARLVKQNFPHLKIHARARNRPHAYQLMEIGVDKLIRETVLSSLHLAEDVLKSLGLAPGDAEFSVEKFRAYDEKLLREQSKFHRDEEQLTQSVKDAADELQRVFVEDNREQRL